jgi:tRNA nucleotidyltransferase/poly(A) polymerase
MKTFKQYFYEATIPKWQQLLEGSDELQAALDLIEDIENKTGKKTLIVGGAVRDLLLGKVPHDVDIATAAPMDQLDELYQTYNIGQSKTFGIVVIKHKGFDFEVANFRMDKFEGEGNSRHPDSVEIAQDFKTDSARRDISINSLGINKDGEIIDYQGGIDDLNNKIIRAVGDPKQRFIEDGLRILRILRFSIKFGFEIEEKTYEAIKELSHLVNSLSKERITEELYKVAGISGKALADYIVKLDEIGLLQSIFPEVYKLKGMVHDPKHHPEGGPFEHSIEALKYSRSSDPVTNIAVLLHDIGKGETYIPQKEHKGRVRIHTYDGHDIAGPKIIAQIGQRLKLSSDDIKAIQFAAYRHMVLHNPERLKLSKLTDIVNNKYWPVLKEASYCDEMSRGDMNASEIAQKFEDIEKRVKESTGSPDDLKQNLKKLIDGNKLLQWIPELNKRDNKPLIGFIIKQVAEHIIDNKLFNITENEVKKIAIDFFHQSL